MKKRSKARSCVGKRRHKTEEQAQAHIRHLVKALGAFAGRYHSYLCPHCGGIHVGHHTGKPKDRR